MSSLNKIFIITFILSISFASDLSSKNITTAKLASPTRIASPLETACPGFTETEYEGEPIGFIKTVPFDFITLPMVSAKSVFEKIIKINRILFFIIANISVLLNGNL